MRAIRGESPRIITLDDMLFGDFGFEMEADSKSDEIMGIIEVEGVKIKAILLSDGRVSFDTYKFLRLGK